MDPMNFGTDDAKSMGCKVRLAQTFRRPGQTTMDIMGELRALTEADIADFARWFNAAGYPTA